jgi:hypothetical protein
VFEVGGCVLRIVSNGCVARIPAIGNVLLLAVVWDGIGRTFEDMYVICQDCCHTEPAGTSTI